MMRTKEELNNIRMVILYLFASLSIAAWFFFISIDVNVQTSITGTEITIQKENKLSNRFYTKIKKISFEDSNNPQNHTVVDVYLLREEGDIYIYRGTRILDVPKYSKSTVQAKIYQIF